MNVQHDNIMVVCAFRLMAMGCKTYYFGINKRNLPRSDELTFLLLHPLFALVLAQFLGHPEAQQFLTALA